MTNKAHHQLLDQLVEEIKNNLVGRELDKLKTDILQQVDKSHTNFLMDVQKIRDDIYEDFVDVAQKSRSEMSNMLKNGKEEISEMVQALVKKEVKMQMEKLKQNKQNKEMDDEALNHDTQPPRNIFFRTNMFRPEVYRYQNVDQPSQSLLALEMEENDNAAAMNML